MKLAIQHLEPNTMGLGLPDSLFFATQPETLAIGSGVFPIILPSGTSYQAGTLRNSFFTKCLDKLNNEYTIYADIIAEGSCVFNVYSQGINGRIQKVASKRFSNIHGVHRLPFAIVPGNIGILRYFIEVESRGIIIKSLYLSTDIADSSIRTTIFLIRTYGNTSGVINSLKRTLDPRFWNGIGDSRETFLSNSHFCIYDSTPDSASILTKELGSLNFNCCAWIGPNLGGGGNASLNLHLAKVYLDNESINHDYVILDDDVCASPETLYRVFALNQIKDPSLTFGSPIFMHSDPQRLWENGGLWGKEFSHGLSKLTSVTPQLIQHGLYFNKYEHIDSLPGKMPIDYTTFNLFSFSGETHSKIGYPAAFFLRGDDVDFSLRCKQHGSLITSPTLAVWQEPAHSYWQEYMAYMHGIIINIVHGEWNENHLVSIIQDKILEHAIHNDLFGVKLYSIIINDIISSDLLLSTCFADLYLERKKEFSLYEKGFDAGIDPYHDINSQQIQVINFVHPSAAPDYSKPFVGLHWPSKKSYYIYERNNSDLRTAVAEGVSKILELLNHSKPALSSATKSLKNRYLKTTQEDFWISALNNHHHELVYSSSYSHEVYQEGEALHTENGLTQIKDLKDLSLESSLTSADYLILQEIFDANRYLELNPDVASSGVDPFEHYVKYGKKEGRSLL